MKTKRAICNLFVVLLAATVLQAGDSWKNKPHTEWSAEEALQVLNKSPWVRVVVPVSPLLRMEGDPASTAANREALRRYVEREREILQAGGAADKQRLRERQITRASYNLHSVARSARSASQVTKLPPVGVRWLSAATLKQAIVRSKQLAQSADEAAIDIFLSALGGYYAISVGDSKWIEVGTPLKLSQPTLSDTLRNQIQQTVYLEMRPSRKKVAPVAVASFAFGVLEPDLVLFFPRESEGQPTIGPQDKKVIFHYGYGRSLAVEFNLSKMTRDGKPDL
jgi:hypothetical protein